jgi:hypothetical protein
MNTLAAGLIMEVYAMNVTGNLYVSVLYQFRVAAVFKKISLTNLVRDVRGFTKCWCSKSFCQSLVFLEVVYLAKFFKKLIPPQVQQLFIVRPT